MTFPDNRAQVKIAEIRRIGYIDQHPFCPGLPGYDFADAPVVYGYDSDIRIFEVIRMKGAFPEADRWMAGCKLPDSIANLRGDDADLRGGRVRQYGLQLFQTYFSTADDQQPQLFQFDKNREQIIAGVGPWYCAIIFHLSWRKSSHFIANFLSDWSTLNV